MSGAEILPCQQEGELHEQPGVSRGLGPSVLLFQT